MVMRYLGGINSPAYNPLASNVTTGANTVQQGGVYTSSSASQNIPSGQWVDDPYFNQTTLLLQADNAVNGAQNNTFIDSSVNNFTVTRNGNPTQGNLSPYSVPETYWSANFDGTGDYLTIADNAAFEPGTNPFCIELWFYAMAISGTPVLTTKRAASSTLNSPFQIYISSSAVTVGFSTTGNFNVGVASLGAAIPSQWNHVAIYRIGNAWYGALNGVVTVVNASNSGSLNNNSDAIVIGGDTNANYFNGYVSNYRFVVGDSVYTSANFTPPTSPLTIVSGTQLLTCQSNRFVDNSGNTRTVNKFADASPRPFSIFNNYQQYNGPVGVESVYFPGSAYGLINQSLMSTTETSFTIEGWVYLTADSLGFPTLLVDDAFGSDPNWAFGVAQNGGLGGNYLTFTVESALGTYYTFVGDTLLSLNTWYYIAVSSNNRDMWLYVNGVKDTVVKGSLPNRFNTDNRTTIGAIGSSGFNFSGLVSNLSFTLGVGKYPNGTTFSVPTGPASPTAANQELLFASPGPVDTNQTVAPKTITYSGTVTTSPTSPFGTSSGFPTAGRSAYFDGTGDYLTLTGSSKLAFGFNDFTIEFWFYINVLPVSPAGSFLYDSRPAADGAYPCVYVAPTSNVLIYYVNTAARITGTTAIKIGQWNHVVVSRVSGNARLFLNGIQEGSTYNDSSINYLNGASRPIIANNGLNLNGLFTGYISNLRVLNGSGVTTVTVPTAPLVPIQGTQLLLNGANSGISDATAKNVMETVGNAQVSTEIKKYGSGSMYFDGTGDWLLIPNNPDINLGTGDFTVECWVNLSNITTTRHLIGKGTASTGWAIYFNAQPTLLIFEYAGSITYSGNYDLIQNQWYHVAVTRSGSGTNNLKMFINGFLIFESTVTTDLTTTNNMYVGASRTATNSMFGYIDDLRITKGVARYTSTFVPPMVALPRQG